MSVPKWFVIINREGEIEVTPFEEERDAIDFYDAHSLQWSDSFICRVEKGPLV